MADIIARGLAKKNTAQLASVVNQNLVADIQAKSYTVGQKIFSKLYGGSYWEVKSSVTMEAATINFTDELHLVVNLVGGGTGIAECQISSILNYAKSINAQKYAETFAKLKRRSAINIACYGDSITYGQGGTNVRNGQPTNFGDGSAYDANNQVDNPYPKVLQDTLNTVYGAGIVSVYNRGYSGDRVGSSYARQRSYSFSNHSLCTINLGTNDMLYATSNGATPDNVFNSPQYNVTEFINSYRKYIVREILRGSAVVLINPSTWVVGTDTTQAKLIQYYRNAIKSLGNELGLLVVDFEDFIGNYINATYLSGVHPTDSGYDLLGKKLASIFIGNGFHSADRISGERQIFGRLFKENLLYGGLTGETIAPYDDASSFASPYNSPTNAYSVAVDAGNTIYYSFYLESDELKFMPVVQIASTGTFSFSLDFGLPQSELKLDTHAYMDKNNRYVPSSTISLTDKAGYYNNPSDLTEHIVIVGKGWHTVSITSTAYSILNGLRFFTDAESMKLNAYKKTGAVTDAYVNTKINLANRCKLVFNATSAYATTLKLFINDDTTETNYYVVDEAIGTIANNAVISPSGELAPSRDIMIEVDLYKISSTKLFAKIKVLAISTDNATVVIKNRIWKYNALSGDVMKIDINASTAFSDSYLAYESL